MAYKPEKTKVVIVCQGRIPGFAESVAAEAEKKPPRVTAAELEVLKHVPPALAPVGYEPLVYHVARSFALQGFKDFEFILPPQGFESDNDGIMALFHEQPLPGCDTSFTVCPAEAPMLHTLVALRERLTQPFILTFGETLSSIDAADFLKKHKHKAGISEACTVPAGAPTGQFAGVAALNKNFLDPRKNAELAGLAKHEGLFKGLNMLLQLPAQPYAVLTSVSAGSFDEWLRLRQAWLGKEPFWRGAYDKFKPPELEAVRRIKT